MIRYYEQTGLIPKADRRESGCRDDSSFDVYTLRFFRRARDMGFSVAEINALLGLWRDETRYSAEVRQLALGHMAELEKRIENLHDIFDTLETLVSACKRDRRPQCPILRQLETDIPDEDLSVRPRRGAVSALQ